MPGPFAGSELGGHARGRSGARVRLADFSNPQFSRGRPALVEAAWIAVQALFVASSLPGSRHRRLLLRAFGARIGVGVEIKPRVRVKFPWRLTVGDHAWIGEDVWIDNLGEVDIGPDACLSQGAYLCTGSHDWSSDRFDLIVRPIRVEQSAWVAARACVGPGVKVGEGAVLSLGSVTAQDLEPWTIYAGQPAKAIKRRSLRSAS